MKHIRYLSDSTPLCEKPEGLGLDAVVADVVGAYDSTCRYCSALLMDHNKKSYEAELVVMNNARVERRKSEPSPLAGWLMIFGFTSAFWIGFFTILCELL
jgi:hypothetical protein